jgi:tubulin polyglutamylase TTLL1
MPFLYNKRKFDIRCYILITSVNDVMKGYWYEEGYIRTSSKEFTLKNLSNRMIHLTNDAVQKKSEDYGKFENANKISFADFQKYLDNSYPESEFNFASKVYPHMIVMNILK